MNPLLHLEHVSLVRDGRAIVDDVTWRVEPGQRWVVLGRNGSGKTSLLRIASLLVHPTHGEVRVLGETLGRTDVRRLRARLGLVSAALADQLRPNLTAHDVVRTARHAALEPWWHSYSDADDDRARQLLAQVGCAALADHPFGTLSSGERQRTQIARALMPDPELLLLDEPMAGLDLAGREQVVETLGAMAGDDTTPPLVLVTHHADEIPPGFTHALLLAEGSVLAHGPLEQILDDDHLSRCFGLPLAVECHDGRWTARRRG